MGELTFIGRKIGFLKKIQDEKTNKSFAEKTSKDRKQ